MRLTRIGIAAAAIVALGALQAEAGTIRVSQETAPGAADWDTNILGHVTPFVTGLTMAGHYQYNAPNPASYNGELNGGPAGVNLLSQLFFVQASDGLAMTFLHDAANDGSGGSANTRFVLAGDTASMIVRDDPGEAGIVDTGTAFAMNAVWVDCCTDGYVLGSLDGNWALFGQFVATPNGIEEWQVTSAIGSETLGLVLQAGRRVRLDFVVPEPGTFALFGLGAFGLLGIGLRRRKRAAASADTAE